MQQPQSLLAIENVQPNALAVINKVGGSIKGEESQKAITADRGAPTAIRPATKGMTRRSKKELIRQKVRPLQSYDFAAFECLRDNCFRATCFQISE